MSQPEAPVRGADSSVIVWPATVIRDWFRTNWAVRLPTLSVAFVSRTVHVPPRSAARRWADTYAPPSSSTMRGRRPTLPDRSLSS